LKTRNRFLGWLAWVSVALGGLAVASTTVGDLVTGTIIAINGNMINIDGHIYSIETGSPAYEASTKFKPGQIVDVQLIGPAKSSSSQAITITLHQGD
jgi:hypothetical protein